MSSTQLKYAKITILPNFHHFCRYYQDSCKMIYRFISDIHASYRFKYIKPVASCQNASKMTQN